MKRIVLSLVLLSALIVAGTLYAQQRRGRQLPQAPQQPTTTVTLYDGGGKVIKTWSAVVKGDGEHAGDIWPVVVEGVAHFVDTASGESVHISGTFIIEGPVHSK